MFHYKPKDCHIHNDLVRWVSLQIGIFIFDYYKTKTFRISAEIGNFQAIRSGPAVRSGRTIQDVLYRPAGPDVLYCPAGPKVRSPVLQDRKKADPAHPYQSCLEKASILDKILCVPGGPHASLGGPYASLNGPMRP